MQPSAANHRCGTMCGYGLGKLICMPTFCGESAKGLRASTKKPLLKKALERPDSLGKNASGARRSKRELTQHIT